MGRAGDAEEPTGARLRRLGADLHLHTVASPCAEIDMLPPLIVERALDLGLGLLAVTDHNTACNAGAVQRAAQGTGLCVWPGLEVQTREEAHVVCLFEDLEAALDWQARVYAALPPLANRPEVFGAQWMVDHRGDYVRTNERLLLTSTALAVEEVVEGVAALGGVTIAAHVDRPSYSLLASLGFVPEGLDLAALEVSARGVRRPPPQARGWPLVSSSDAHRLEEMRVGMFLEVAEPTLAELRMALGGRGGRRVLLSPSRTD